MKTIRLYDQQTIDALERMAKDDNRTLSNLVNVVLGYFVINGFTGHPAPGTPELTTPLPKKTESPKPTGISGAQYDSYEKTEQAKLADIIKDPVFIARAVEGSMDKRIAVMDGVESTLLPIDSDAAFATALERECCLHPTRPCKHWVWDTDSGDGYKNSLSGRYREAE